MRAHVRMVWLLLIVVLLPCLDAAPVFGESGLATPPDPQRVGPTGVDWLDNIYLGAAPPEAGDKPVLVFVHGLGRDALDWWAATGENGPNDMYLTAYRAGYRTAFVTLDFPEDEEPHSVQDNGTTLSKQIKAIARLYGVAHVDVIAHSKGGVDAQSAIVYSGAWPYVRNVFTLGTPHQGSELADLLYSGWAQWIADLLGGQNEATYSMTTGYMRFFRAFTDRKTEDDAVHYYSAAGTAWGGEGSPLRYSGAYLSQYGANDGLVTVASTALTGSLTLFVEPYSHYELPMGSTAFPHIEAVLHDIERSQVCLPVILSGAGVSTTVSSEPPALSFSDEPGLILRGGLLSSQTVEILPLETDVRSVQVSLLTSHSPVKATFVGPGGASYALEPAGQDREYFAGAYRWVSSIKHPAAGRWQLDLSGPDGSAYLLALTLDSPLQMELAGLREEPLAPGNSLRLSLLGTDHLGRAVATRTEAELVKVSSGENRHASRLWGGRVTELDQAPADEGIYVLSTTVTGETADGMPFERSIVSTFAVAEAETLRAGRP